MKHELICFLTEVVIVPSTECNVHHYTPDERYHRFENAPKRARCLLFSSELSEIQSEMPILILR